MRPKVIEESILRNGFVIRDEYGRVTHRIEKSVLGDELLVRNVATGKIDLRAQDIF